MTIMDQADARRHARMLSEVTGTIHVATTLTALRGQCPAEHDVWVIMPVGAYPIRRAITTVDDAVAKINRHGKG